MGVVIPQVITPSKASGAQIIDGSLRFDSSKSQYLQRTFGSGNRKTYTWSGWVKKTKFGDWYGSLLTRTDELRISNSEKLSFNNSGVSNLESTGVLRDPSSFYHVVFRVDTTQSSGKIKGYINGVEFLNGDASISTNADTDLNDAAVHYIGNGTSSRYADYHLSQCYFIDGQALGPGYFGFTDPLTGTWRPKRLKDGAPTVNDGTVWSDSLTGARTDTNLKTDAFDGSLTTKAGSSTTGTGAQLTFTSPKPIHYSSSVKVYVYWGVANDVTMRLDGGESITVPGNTWTTLVEGTGSFKTLTVNGTTNSAELSAIEVDGVIMTDATTTNVDFGTNGFYLPLDGNSPIGKDQSGNGNDWTPVNFGGTVELDKATGALPILNTVNGGNVATAGVRTDSSYDNLILALPYAGSAADVTTSIGSTTTSLMTSWDANSASFASTGNGTLYDSALHMNGASDYPRINFSAGRMNFMHNSTGTGTIEFWAKPSSVTTSAIWAGISGGSDEIGFGIYSNNNGTEVGAFISNGTAGQSSGTTASDAPTPQGVWVHIAAVKTPTQIRLYTDGVLRATKDISGYTFNDDNSTRSFIQHGSDIQQSGTRGWSDAYMFDFRVYEGLEKYTGTTVGTQYFVPPSTSPDILPDTPSGVSGSSKLTKITDGAVYLRGSESSDELQIDDSLDFHLSNNDFTLECFIYQNAAANSNGSGIHGQWNIGGGPSDNGYLLWVDTNQKFGYYDSSDGTNGTINLQSQANAISLNRWHHVAATRSGNTFKIFVDGIQVGSTTGSHSVNNATTTYKIGAWAASASNFPGYISNVRLVNGTALYTSDFTPPTRTLTNVTNTKLLCCQSVGIATAAAVSPSAIHNNVSINSYRENTSSTNQNWDQSSDASSTSSALNHDELYWLYLDAEEKVKEVTFDVVASGQSSNSSVNYIIYHSQNSNSVGNSVCNGGCDQTFEPVATGTSPGSYSVTVTFPTAQTSRYIAITNGNSVAGGTYVYSNVKVKAAIPVATNFTPFNTDINTVRGQETGYATWNPLKMGTSDVSMSEGNLFWRTTSNGPDRCTYSTIGMDSGKFYWENEIVEATATAVGIANILANQDAGPANAHNWMYYSATGQVYLDGSASSYGDAYNTNGTIIGVAFDRDNLTLEFYKNGVSQGKLTSISGLTDSETYFAMCGDSGGASQSQVRVNFGQKPFKYAPPEGFQPLNAANARPSTVISRPDQYVGVTTYTGSGAARDIKLGRQPDFIWTKQRAGGSLSGGRTHELIDSVRGTEKGLATNSTDGEYTSTGSVTSFNYDGYTIGSEDRVNENNATYVAWTWKAGGNKNTFNVDNVGYSTFTTAPGLNSGTIALTGASVGTKQGFSIIKYTGTGTAGTISHGLSQEPDFVIVKQTSSSTTNKNWCVYHRSLGGTKVTLLNSDAASATTADTWNDTDPTSTLITLGAGDDAYATQTNVSSKNYICYAWHDVPGLQKFGNYSGSGSDDGTFVECGFKPALVIVKCDSTTGQEWIMWDSERAQYNEITTALHAHATDSEATVGTTRKVDFLSNGFKLRNGSSGATDYSGRTYIYAAWAEAPSFNLYGGGANAR